MSLAEFDARANQLAHETAGQSVTSEDGDTRERGSQGITEPLIRTAVPGLLMPDPISFVATLAGANTSARWLSVGHDGDCKVTLEASADQLAAVLRLALLNNQAFTVRVEPVEG